MSAKYPAVYALLRERMADEGDIPDTDEIIAASLDVARAAVTGMQMAEPDPAWDGIVNICAEQIDILREES